MKRWIIRAGKVLTRPIIIALIVGLLAAWQFTGNYRLKQLWRKPIDSAIGHIVHSSSGVVRLYAKGDNNRSWFVGNEANCPQVELQVPKGASFWGQDYFSQDGKWYAINGSYQHKSESILFVFETSTGKLVSDIPVHRGSAELASFLPRVDLLVLRDGIDLKCWDIKQNKLHSIIKHDQLFLALHLACSSDGSRLYCFGPLMKSMYDEKPENMQLRCWSVSEQRELFRVNSAEHAEHQLWGLILDESDSYLFGVFESEGRRFEHHRDNNVVTCWDARDGRLIRTYSKVGGESADPIIPLDIDHYLVFLDPKPPSLRRFWKQWINNEPGWLKSWMPYQCWIDVRDMLTGTTVQRLSVPYGHWPRFHTTQGKFLQTYSKVNGQEEIAYWMIEECNRLHDVLLVGISVMLATWIGLLMLVRLRSARRLRALQIKSKALVQSLPS